MSFNLATCCLNSHQLQLSTFIICQLFSSALISLNSCLQLTTQPAISVHRALPLAATVCWRQRRRRQPSTAALAALAGDIDNLSTGNRRRRSSSVVQQLAATDDDVDIDWRRWLPTNLQHQPSVTDTNGTNQRQPTNNRQLSTLSAITSYRPTI